MPGESDRTRKGILQPGSSFGRYKVHRFLGRGGMGEVYEVEHQLDGTHYAMKVLSSEIRQTPENIRRFEREAQVMARLRHPNVVSVDYFDETDGKYWFRMELAPGIEEGVVTLGDLAAKNGGRIGQGLLVGLFEQILDGLSCAHKAGVIHRDLKPGNILLVLSDKTAGSIVPKISDFGLVRLVGQDWLLKKTLLSAQQSQKEGGTDETKDSQGLSTQSLVGTYAYMSPEQKQRKEIDERSDIYAVGLMIYRLLTGYTNPGEKIRNKDSTLHAFWQRIIDQSVREDPEDRFSDVAAMLEQIQRGHRVLASLDGKASLKKCSVELQAKRYYTANRYLDEAVMIFPNDPEVLEFQTFMREQLSTLHDLKSKTQDLRRQKKYNEALAAAEQFRTVCIEDENINKFIDECPQLIAREQLGQLIEEASRLLEAGKYEAAHQAAQKALSLDHENSEAQRIDDQALALLKKIQIQHTREQVHKALQKTYSLLKQKRYAQALDALNHSPCSDSNHPKVVALRNACEAGLKTIRQYWERAEKAKASSDTQGAMALLNEVLDSVAPEDPGTLERLNQIRSEAKELSAAETDMDQAWKNKCYKVCREAVERILTIQPEHTKAQQIKRACVEKIQAIRSYVDKAEDYYRNQQYDEAIAAFEQTKEYYYLGKRRAKGDAEIETQHSVYSPEYKEILDRIAAARQAKTSMEQALQRAKDRLEAGDLVETRLSLDEYFELQTDGSEGLILQQRLESLHGREMRGRWIRRSVASLAVVILIGIGLAYGMASLMLTHRMQKELERSRSGLTFANLKETQKQAAIQLAILQQSRLIPLFSVKARWKDWQESLQRSEPAWEDYARGAYQEGQRKFENTPRTEFSSWIQSAFDTFVQDANELCADVNDHLAKGEYSDCISDCNAYLLDYPQHRSVSTLLQKANRARELQRCVYDTNDLQNLSDHIGSLIEISPRHHHRQTLETHCIQKVKSHYDFLDQPLPTNVDAIVKQHGLCNHALKVLTLFKQCHGYHALYETITDRRKELEDLVEEGKVLAKAKRLVDEGYWGTAEQILDTLNTNQDEVARLKNIVAEKIARLNDLVNKTNGQIEKDYWFDAETKISEVWIVWKRDDHCDSLQQAKELEAHINDVVQTEREVIRVFLERFDQNSHDQIERFLQDRIENNPDLVEVYAKWFVRLNRDAQDAVEKGLIDTALNLLSRVLNNEETIRRANDERLKESLHNLRKTKATTDKIDQRRDKALAQTDTARTSQSNMQYPEALWNLHVALEIDPECDSARNLQIQLQTRERSGTQFGRYAKSLYDDKCYFTAQRYATLAAKEFPGDLRVMALSHDLDATIEEARRAARNVLNRRTSVREFYDTYADFDEFPSDVDKRIRKAILRDLKERVADSSQEKRKGIIIRSRREILQNEAEYQALDRSEEWIPPFPENISNPDWCQIHFYTPPGNMHITLYIEGHGFKVPERTFVRCQDDVRIRVSESSNPNCCRTQGLSLKSWKAHRIRLKPACLSVKKAHVQVVRKGWLFKEYDLDAMTGQIMKEYQIDKATAKNSLQATLDQLKDRGNITTLHVPLIGCWEDEQFMECNIEE